MKEIICAVVFLIVGSLVEGKSKYVSVNLDAKWDSTPMLLEASEFLASEGNENFWGFVGRITDLKPEMVQEETDEAMYHLIQKYSSRYITPMLQNFMKLSLSLRSYSPTVEMYQQMSRDADPPDDCKAFVDVHGKKTCDAAKVDQFIADVSDRVAPALFKSDHIYPGSNDAGVTVILYGEMGTAEFKPFHTKLSELANKKEITYVLRHYRQSSSHQKTRLSGYGVELAIKSTEYKAKDDTKVEGEHTSDEEEDLGEEEVEGFMFGKLKELHPDIKDDLKRFRSSLAESSTELAAFKVWQLQDLGLQAAQKVVSAAPNDTLRVLRDVSQNFPSEARSLVKVNVKEELKKEISKNQQYFENYHGLPAGESALYLNGIPMDMEYRRKYFENYHGLPAGESALYLNGIPMDMEVYDVFSLLDIMRSEAKIMEGLFSLGLKGDELNRLLKLEASSGKDEFALDIRHNAVQFVNDLEKDEKYKGWPSRAQDILRPTYPGMLRHVAKNFFNLVFIVDPLDKESRELLKMAEAFLVHSVPIRIGLVFALKQGASVMEDAGVALAYAFNYIKQTDSAEKGLTFITDVYEAVGEKELTQATVVTEFINQFTGDDVEEVFGSDSEHDFVRKSSDDFVSKSGLSDFPQVLMNGVPLNKKDLTQDGFEEGVITQIMTMTPEIQQAVYQGRLHDGHTTLEWLMEQEHVLPRLNSRVLTPPSSTLDLTENIEASIFQDPDSFGMMTSKDMAGIMAGNINYLRRNEEDSLSAVSMWIVCDLHTPHGRDVAYSALKRLKHSHDLRVGFIFNRNEPGDVKVDVNKAVYVAVNTLPLSHAKNFVTKLVKEENYVALQDGSKSLEDLEVHGMDMKAYKKALSDQSDSYLRAHRAFVDKALGFAEGQRGILTNGRVLGPLGEEEEFLPEDIDLLEVYVKQQSAKQIKSELKSMGYKGDKGSDLVMKIGGLLGTKSSQTRKKIHYHNDRNSVIRLPADPNSPAFQVEAIVDPASTAAQKLAPILMALKEVTNMDITIFMNCQDKLSEMPLKSFYRYVLEPELTFKVDGSLSLGPSARFDDLPQKSLLTLGMSPPESWLVEAVRTQYDLDNILLEEVKSGGIQANFDLEYLLLEGHCHDANTGQPPRGLQFTMGTNMSDVVMDTIVMANLGYFQLKANPGAWMLRLREGRSREIYQIASHEHTDTPEGSTDLIVTIGSFKSRTIRVKVSKKTGMEKEKLLDDNGKEEDKGIWDTISSSWSGGEKSLEDADQTLNIFSVASGHLYERLLRIMMMSVIKTTKSKVKFWFLKNYLSPSFKDFIPHYAKEYGFEYELVQYKWPKWLNQQKEKQRIIWGYKILFLDVLFPLDVKKIIFVDADQIVRTDLQELHDFDLKGAPYGYTPFCNDRKEMDGFRFWKSGYWASHLAGRRYHISALYVIDLKRFRRIAAGDRLRGQYQGLSQDPNSLSNLDQDLPNNMIHQVAIKSLPQEWLWCETWCSDESKANAKTIDLCNNPMTKEPKLKAAMRIVPEWKVYDYEIKVFWDTIYGTNTRSQVEYEPPELNPEKKEAWRDRIEL